MRFVPQYDMFSFGTRTVMCEMKVPVNRLPAVSRMRGIELCKRVVFGIAYARLSIIALFHKSCCEWAITYSST